MQVTVFGKSDRGLIREKNEDSFSVDEDSGLFSVADGLGGLPHGEEASATAVELFENRAKEFIDPEGVLNFQAFYESIQDAVNAEGMRLNGDFGIATTLTGVQLLGDTLRIGHVGDSGVLLIRGNGVEHLTTDHTMAHDILEVAQKGEMPYVPEYYHHVLQRCIGNNKSLKVEVLEEKVQRGDYVLLYTDGLTKMFGLGEIAEIIRNAESMEDAVEALIQGANARGGDDNTTVVCLAFS